MTMRVKMFYHSLISDWNHGNAHFLRGVARELRSRGHEVEIFEPKDSWSLENLLRLEGRVALHGFQRAYPELHSRRYDLASLHLDEALDGADLVLVHEWNDPELLRRLSSHRRKHHYRLLFHDTHHRAVTSPRFVEDAALHGFDGVLAYGASLAALYERRGFDDRVWVWHEAADVSLFRPLPPETGRAGDLVWIGNWGDGERTNWWVPNPPAVEAMLRSSGFRVLQRLGREIYLCEPDRANPSSFWTWDEREYFRAVAPHTPQGSTAAPANPGDSRPSRKSAEGDA